MKLKSAFVNTIGKMVLLKNVFSCIYVSMYLDTINPVSL